MNEPAAAAAEDEESGSVSFLADAAQRWDDAALVASLIAIDPGGLKGVSVKAAPGPVRDLWLELYRRMTGEDHRIVSLPANADESRVLGGLDLVETLTAGRPVLRSGLLREADGGTILVRMAERTRSATSHALADALDHGAVRVERDGLSEIDEACFTLILFDEGEADEGPPGNLLERLSFRIRLDGIPVACVDDADVDMAAIARARALLPSVQVDDAVIEALGSACLACGVRSMRAHVLCVRAAKALAALAGQDEVRDGDAQAAARLVLTPRAVSLPETEPEDQPGEQESGNDQPPEPPEDEAEEQSPDDQPEEQDTDDTSGDVPLEEMITEAIKSGAVSIAQAREAAKQALRRPTAAGRAGEASKSKREGRPIGSEPGDPRQGGRLDVLATLRAAVPWQRLRPPPAGGARLRIYPSDLRIRKYAHNMASSVIFVVDASGSSAMHRLAEAKGAVETLLLECYSRRDMVSLITFKGSEAECVLPPCRSLARARRAMAGLPGGGGTPLASAIELAWRTAMAEREEGRSPLLVFLTDGQANIALSGEPGRRQAGEDVSRLAPIIAAHSVRTLFFDTSPRPSDKARTICDKMDGTYVPLPYADGSTVSAAVRAEQAASQKTVRR